MNEARVLILAAGEGNRLRPHTADRPKCLVPIRGKSLIERQLEVIRKCGIHRIGIVRGYRAEALSLEGVEFFLNPNFATTNMVHTLFSASQDFLFDDTTDLVLAYGDIVYSSRVLVSLLRSQEPISVVTDRQWLSYWSCRFSDPLQDAETFKVDPATGKIKELGRKATLLKEIEGQYIGLMKFTPQGFESLLRVYNQLVLAGQYLGKPIKKIYMTDLLQAAIDAKISLSPIWIDGDWIEVDSVEDLNNPATLERLQVIQ